MSITRTIPRDEVESHIRPWFAGDDREQRFPVKGRPSRVFPGDYLYIIWKGSIYGRFRVKSVEDIGSNNPPIVGSKGKLTGGTHNIVVEAPGELAPREIKRRGHLAIRYDNVPEWP